jgi:hypothetical protein
MGMCSHAHDNDNDPILSLSCYVAQPEDVLRVTIDICPEVTDTQTAVIAKHLSDALYSIGRAAMRSAQEAN